MINKDKILIITKLIYYVTESYDSENLEHSELIY